MKHGAKYDFLIVGSGLFGSVCAYELTKKGKKCLIIDKRTNVGGNCYTENINDIHVHKYGAHIFHTNDKDIWDYINQFAKFRNFINTPIANYKGELYSLPFNMWTFNKLWGVTSPDDAKKIIEDQKFKGIPKNLEEQALSMVGKDVYDKLIKGYTEKQWNRSAKDLPTSIIKRIPIRFNWDNNYFNDLYQGIPIGGYTQIFEKMLDGIDLELGVDFFDKRDHWESISESIIYTGPIDKFFDYKFGRLEYRSLFWKTEVINSDNFQGNAVINYTDYNIPYTRILEHKWFDNQNQKNTIISYEYPTDYVNNNEPYYPIRDDINTSIYEKYLNESKTLTNYIFGGRLATYAYYDMHQVIAQAIQKIKNIE
jgi:UDP-galactopyranose mutase